MDEEATDNGLELLQMVDKQIHSLDYQGLTEESAQALFEDAGIVDSFDSIVRMDTKTFNSYVKDNQFTKEQDSLIRNIRNTFRVRYKRRKRFNGVEIQDILSTGKLPCKMSEYEMRCLLEENGSPDALPFLKKKKKIFVRYCTARNLNSEQIELLKIVRKRLLQNTSIKRIQQEQTVNNSGETLVDEVYFDDSIADSSFEHLSMKMDTDELATAAGSNSTLPNHETPQSSRHLISNINIQNIFSSGKIPFQLRYKKPRPRRFHGIEIKDIIASGKLPCKMTDGEMKWLLEENRTHDALEIVTKKKRIFVDYCTVKNLNQEQISLLQVVRKRLLQNTTIEKLQLEELLNDTPPETSLHEASMPDLNFSNPNSNSKASSVKMEESMPELDLNFLINDNPRIRRHVNVTMQSIVESGKLPCKISDAEIQILLHENGIQHNLSIILAMKKRTFLKYCLAQDFTHDQQTLLELVRKRVFKRKKIQKNRMRLLKRPGRRIRPSLPPISLLRQEREQTPADRFAPPTTVHEDSCFKKIVVKEEIKEEVDSPEPEIAESSNFSFEPQDETSNSSATGVKIEPINEVSKANMQAQLDEAGIIITVDLIMGMDRLMFQKYRSNQNFTKEQKILLQKIRKRYQKQVYKKSLSGIASQFSSGDSSETIQKLLTENGIFDSLSAIMALNTDAFNKYRMLHAPEQQRILSAVRNKLIKKDSKRKTAYEIKYPMQPGADDVVEEAPERPETPLLEKLVKVSQHKLLQELAKTDTIVESPNVYQALLPADDQPTTSNAINTHTNVSAILSNDDQKDNNLVHIQEEDGLKFFMKKSKISPRHEFMFAFKNFEVKKHEGDLVIVEIYECASCLATANGYKSEQKKNYVIENVKTVQVVENSIIEGSYDGVEHVCLPIGTMKMQY